MSTESATLTASPCRSSNQLAFTVDEFCHYHNVSRPFFYKMLKAGIGPRFFKVGARTLVSTEAAAAWRREREAATRNAA